MLKRRTASAGFFSQIWDNKLVFYSVIPYKDALYDSHLCTHALGAKNKLKELGVIISYKITADYVSETPIEIEENVENTKFLYLYPISYLNDYEQLKIL